MAVWESKSSLSAIKRTLKAYYKTSLYIVDRERLLALDYCKIAEIRSFPKASTFELLQSTAVGRVMGRRGCH